VYLTKQAHCYISTYDVELFIIPMIFDNFVQFLNYSVTNYQSQAVTLACELLWPQKHHTDARSHPVLSMCNLYLDRCTGIHIYGHVCETGDTREIFPLCVLNVKP